MPIKSKLTLLSKVSLSAAGFNFKLFSFSFCLINASIAFTFSLFPPKKPIQLEVAGTLTGFKAVYAQCSPHGAPISTHFSNIFISSSLSGFLSEGILSDGSLWFIRSKSSLWEGFSMSKAGLPDSFFKKKEALFIMLNPALCLTPP